MKQKTSMFGSAMSSYSAPKQSEPSTEIVPGKVGRPKGSIKKEVTKRSFTTKLDITLLDNLKELSEEKAQPINRIIEDLVQYSLIGIGRSELFHTDLKNKAEHAKACKQDVLIISDRYKKLL
ncbi:MAG: hypothetical protein KBT06_06505 [Prevotellaceae bacterium]|nr:hypothetical protein [Candidatus Colivivens equi]